MARSKWIGALPLAILATSLFALSPAFQGKPAKVLLKDAYPKGCVSCHTKGKKDRTIPAMLKKVKGHPNVASMMKVLPTNCGMCHKTGPKPPALKQMIHKIHFKGKPASIFAKKPAGPCLNCHIPGKKGKASVKTGPKNW